MTRRAVTASVIALTAALLLTGCGSSSGHAKAAKSTPASVATTSPNLTLPPTPTATEAASTVPNYTSNLSASDIATYRAMSPVEFNSLAKGDQISYILSEIGGTSAIQEFADDYYRVTQDPNDKLTIPLSSKDASQDVVTAELNYNSRIPLMLDGDDRAKASIAFLEGGMQDPLWPAWNEADNSAPDDLTGGAAAVDKIAPGNVISSMGETKLDPGSHVVRDVVSLNLETGASSNSEIYYVEIPTNQGSLGWWL